MEIRTALVVPSVPLVIGTLGTWAGPLCTAAAPSLEQHTIPALNPSFQALDT